MSIKEKKIQYLNNEENIKDDYSRILQDLYGVDVEKLDFLTFLRIYWFVYAIVVDKIQFFFCRGISVHYVILRRDKQMWYVTLNEFTSIFKHDSEVWISMFEKAPVIELRDLKVMFHDDEVIQSLKITDLCYNTGE